MIYKGNKHIVEVYKGDKEYSDIYKGGKRVFKNWDEYIGNVPASIYGTKNSVLKKYKIYGNIAQNATPTPEAPVEVLGVGNKTDNGYEIPVVNRGKNLLDFKTMGGVTKGHYLSEMGDIYSSNAWQITDFIPCCGKTFTISKIGGQNASVCLYDKNKNFIIGKKYNTKGAYDKTSVTIESKTIAHYVRFSYYILPDALDVLERIQLELGSEATPYEAYRAPITKPIYLLEPLYKDDYIYKDKSGGMVHRAWGVKVFDGTEYFDYDETNCRFVCSLENMVIKSAVRVVHMYSTHYSVLHNREPFSHAFDNVMYNDNGEERILIHDRRFAKIDDFKSFLASEYAKGTPVTVYYPLAEPTEESIELPDLPLEIGYNVIDVDTSIKPEKIALTYKSSKAAAQADEALTNEILNLMEAM